jgi:putative endonuclease
MPYVYLVRCVDGSLYVGHTENLATRERVHNEGGGAHYTSRRRPVRIVYAEEYQSLRKALKRERQLNHWTKPKKEALIAGNLTHLKQLSKRR